MKQTLKEFGAGVRVAVGGLGRGAIKAMTAPLVGLHRFKPTPKLDAPAIRGGESAPVEVLFNCSITTIVSALESLTSVAAIPTVKWCLCVSASCMLKMVRHQGEYLSPPPLCIGSQSRLDWSLVTDVIIVHHQKDTKLRPQQTGANLVFLSARPEMYKVAPLLTSLCAVMGTICLGGHEAS